MAVISASTSFLGLDPVERDRVLGYCRSVSYPPEAVIIAEGSSDRALYVVTSGEARIDRRGVEVGVAGPGDHFGELALIAGRLRAASVTAVTELAAWMLGPDDYRRLVDHEPGIALRLVEVLVAGVGDRLTEMTESVSQLLHERSLPRRAQVVVTLGGEKIRTRNGTRLGELLAGSVGGDELIVAGLVDRRPLSLSSPISADSNIEALTRRHWEGQRIYRESVGLLLLEAVHRIDPAIDVQLGHSLGFAQRLLLRDIDGLSLAELGERVERTMRELVAEARPLREELWTLEEARTHFAARGWDSARELLATWRDTTVPLVSYGDVYALHLSPFLSTTRDVDDFSLVADERGWLLIHGRRDLGADELAIEARSASSHVERMTSHHHRWLRALGMISVGAFNLACLRGSVAELIHVVEGFQEKRISQIADAIGERAGDIEVVCIAGPSSSGKTTFIKRLKIQLQVNGLNPVGLSLDDYYVDRARTPRDPDGELDFEAFETLRVDLLQEHLGRLHAGERVTTARYDFHSGTSHAEGGPSVQLGSSDIIMLEGIHGLNPRLLESLPERSVFRIYICPLAQLPFDRLSRVHASDLRLLRRIVRDRHTRSISVADNIDRWPSVRRGERRHIYPYQENADEIFDSSLIYEPSVLKVFAERYLLEVPRAAAAYTTALRLLKLLDRFIAIYPDHVPPTSILREFIGGSGFEY